MQHCDFITAVKSLEEPGNIRIPVYQKGNNLPVPPSIEIKRIRPLADPRLLYYLRTRGIKPEIGIQHCREVYYKFSSEKMCIRDSIFAYLNVMAKQLIKTSDYRKVLLHGLKVNPTAFYVGVEVLSLIHI